MLSKGSIIASKQVANKILSKLDVMSKPRSKPSSTTEATASDDITPFRFLDLPRELRDEVYLELLICRSNYKNKPLAHSAILRANRQIYGEAHQIIYKENSWVVTTLARDNPLTSLVRPKAREGLSFFGGKPAAHVEIRISYPWRQSSHRSQWVVPAHLACRQVADESASASKRSTVLDLMGKWTVIANIEESLCKRSIDEEAIIAYLRDYGGPARMNVCSTY